MAAEGVKLLIPLALLAKMRVQWFNGSGWIRGQVIAIYADGTCDVYLDTGRTFKGWPLHQLIAETET
jgi:hypothetical protein